MAILETFIQQPADRLDYDVGYTEFLTDSDFVVSATAEVDLDGLDFQQPIVLENGTKLKLFVTGGVSGSVYKLTLTVTTDLGRVKQDELRFRIKDY